MSNEEMTGAIVGSMQFDNCWPCPNCGKLNPAGPCGAGIDLANRRPGDWWPSLAFCEDCSDEEPDHGHYHVVETGHMKFSWYLQPQPPAL